MKEAEVSNTARSVTPSPLKSPTVKLPKAGPDWIGCLTECAVAVAEKNVDVSRRWIQRGIGWSAEIRAVVSRSCLPSPLKSPASKPLSTRRSRWPVGRAYCLGDPNTPGPLLPLFSRTATCRGLAEVPSSHSSDIEIPVTIQINQDRGSSVGTA